MGSGGGSSGEPLPQDKQRRRELEDAKGRKPGMRPRKKNRTIGRKRKRDLDKRKNENRNMVLVTQFPKEAKS